MSKKPIGRNDPEYWERIPEKEETMTREQKIQIALEDGHIVKVGWRTVFQDDGELFIWKGSESTERLPASAWIESDDIYITIPVDDYKCDANI